MLNNIERDKRTGVQWKYAGSKRTGKTSTFEVLLDLSCTYNKLCINISPNLFLFSFPFVKGYEYVGFLWRKHRPGLPELTMSGGELFNDKYINFTRKPFVGHFQVRYTSIRFKVCILCIIGEWLEIYCGECAPES